jgi:hypothetical protein
MVCIAGGPTNRDLTRNAMCVVTFPLALNIAENLIVDKAFLQE